MLSLLDLYCGGGGTSSGIKEACDKMGRDYRLVGLNHWDIAIATHNLNHLGAAHEANIYITNPNWAVPAGYLDILWASIECIYHSKARTKKGPCNEQSRSAAFDLYRWIDCLDTAWLMLENVSEFIDWGPVDKEGTPIKERAGEYFKKWLDGLTERGYKFEYRILNSADYGAFTARKRFFFIATKTGKEIVWPEKTHEGNWNKARDIIDWDLKGNSVFFRKKPLVRNSMRRVCHGLRKFNGIELDLDYAMECAEKHQLPRVKYQEKTEPFLTKYNGGVVPRTHSVEEPLRTVDTANRFALLTPFFAQQYSSNATRDVERPLPTVTVRPKSYVCEPYLVENYGMSNSMDINNPVPAVVANPKGCVCEPFLLPQHQGYDKMNVRSTDKPLQTLTAAGCEAVLTPFLTKYFGTGVAVPVSKPLSTICTKDTFGLAEPMLRECCLDVDYRMMQVHELSAAMGFPEDYKFAGTATDAKRMIGNAVETHTAEALITAVLKQHLGE